MNIYISIQFLLIKNCFHMIYLLSSYMWFLQLFLYLVIVSSKQYTIQKQSLVRCLADKKRWLTTFTNGNQLKNTINYHGAIQYRKQEEGKGWRTQEDNPKKRAGEEGKDPIAQEKAGKE